MNSMLRPLFLISCAVALFILFLGGCVANKAYRIDRPVLHELVSPAGSSEQQQTPKYSLAFVEFDDLGEMFTQPTGKTELEQTLDEVKVINASGAKPVFVIFVHGWKNNASDSSGNVWGFRSELQSIAREVSPRPVMGIYVGWRGAVLRPNVLKEFSFWNRKDAATRIPGAHLTETLRRIMIEVKKNIAATCVVVGHSFGGLVTERTLTQAMVELTLSLDNHARLDDQAQGLQTPADLIVLLNEAGPATESKEFLDYLKRQGLEFSDSNGVKHPLFLSLTSTGDSATHVFFPVGQFLGKRGLTTRKYQGEDCRTESEKEVGKNKDEIRLGQDCFGETNQNSYFLHTTANSPKLISHVVVKSTDPHQPPTPPYTEFSLGDVCYRIYPRPNALNTTPYWVLQVPTEFVPDHSTIFKPEFRLLLEAFLVRHGIVSYNHPPGASQSCAMSSQVITAISGAPRNERASDISAIPMISASTEALSSGPPDGTEAPLPKITLKIRKQKHSD